MRCCSRITRMAYASAWSSVLIRISTLLVYSAPDSPEFQIVETALVETNFSLECHDTEPRLSEQDEVLQIHRIEPIAAGVRVEIRELPPAANTLRAVMDPAEVRGRIAGVQKFPIHDCRDTITVDQQVVEVVVAMHDGAVAGSPVDMRVQPGEGSVHHRNREAKRREVGVGLVEVLAHLILG